MSFVGDDEVKIVTQSEADEFTAKDVTLHTTDFQLRPPLPLDVVASMVRF